MEILSKTRIAAYGPKVSMVCNYLTFFMQREHNLTDIKAQPNDNQTEQFKFY